MKRSWKENGLARIHKQRPVLLIFCIILGVLLVVGSTFAWFTASDTRTNPFRAKDYVFDFKVTEEFTPPTEVEPGDTITKEVAVTNTGDLPGFVRVLVHTEIVAADGTLLPSDSSAVSFEDIADTDDWRYGEDGYWYYLHVVEPGEKTPNIFTGVTLLSSVNEQYKQAGMRVDVKLEAVETKKWEYREGWWGSDSPPTTSPLNAIDAKLAALAS